MCASVAACFNGLHLRDVEQKLIQYASDHRDLCLPMETEELKYEKMMQQFRLLVQDGVYNNQACDLGLQTLALAYDVEIYLYVLHARFYQRTHSLNHRPGNGTVRTSIHLLKLSDPDHYDALHPRGDQETLKYFFEIPV